MINILKCYYQNVRGLKSKTIEVRNRVRSSDHDVIIFTETWLNSSVFDRELFDDRYIVYRRDRETSVLNNSKKSGGGVLIAVSNKWISHRLTDWESEHEDLWVSIEYGTGKNKQSINICAVYLRPPVSKYNLMNYLEATDKFTQHAGKDLLIVGDFNLSGIHWKRPPGVVHTMPENYNNCEIKSSFIDFITLNNLKQYNYITNFKDGILDLILSNLEDIRVKDCKYHLREIDKFHPPIEILLNLSQPKIGKPIYTEKFNFYKADYNEILSNLQSIDWNTELKFCADINEMVTVFYRIITDNIKKYVPVTRLTKSKEKYPIWFSKDLIKMLKLKYKYRIKLKKYNNPLDRIEFKYLRKDCDRLIISCYNNYIKTIEDEISTHCKYFWTHIKNLRKNSSNYPSTMMLNGIKYTNDEDICNVFAEHFASVYEPDNLDYRSPDNLDYRNIPILGHFSFNPKDIRLKLSKLDESKSGGPDGVPPIYWRNCANELSIPLAIIFNSSLAAGEYPDIWKRARIVPIYKSGAKELITNYRPISILNVASKVFESLVYEILYSHIKNYISYNQHGFMAHRSTNSNLVQYISDAKECVDLGMQYDVIYTDFSRAFDKVNHSILLSKLHSYGISGVLLDWCKSYLQKRCSNVVLNGNKSMSFIACSGMPQGSNLGPLFFNIFINDISKDVKHSKIYLFADDLKVARVIKNQLDSQLLQNDVNIISKWCHANKMILNLSKCYHVKLTRKHLPIQTRYNILGNELDELSLIRDLGVWVDSELRFSMHLDNILESVNRTLGFVFRSGREFKRPSTMIKLYNAFVRPKLEYCSSVWYPTQQLHINRIENVQKKLVKHLSYRFRVPKRIAKSYDEKLQYFKLTRLYDRRKLHDMIFLHKLFNNFIDCPPLLSKFKLNVPRRIPRKPTALMNVPVFRTNLGRDSPVTRLCRMYNDIATGNNSIDLSFNKTKFKSCVQSAIGNEWLK